jgi:hypothetical protein
MKTQYKLLSCLLLSLFLFSSIVSVQGSTMQTVNQFEVYGTSSTSWTIYGSDYEKDVDVQTNISENSLHLFDSNYKLNDFTVDLTETSIGKASPDDWSTVSDTYNYWVANSTFSRATVQDGSSDTVNKQAGTPSSDSGLNGFAMRFTSSMNGESTENADRDGVVWHNTMNQVVGDDDCLLLSYEFDPHSDAINKTKNVIVGVYATIEDSAGNYISINMQEGCTSSSDNTEFKDGSSSYNPNAFLQSVTQDDTVFVRRNFSTADTIERVRLVDIQDVLRISSEAGSGATPTKIVEMGVWMSYKYAVGSDSTFTIKQATLVDEVDDLSFFEKVDSSDSLEKRENNLFNATSISIEVEDDYNLVNGYDFALDSDLPLNRLTLSSYNVIVDRYSTQYTETDRDNLVAKRRDQFDTSPDSDERITMPTTMYLNLSLLNPDYQFMNIWIEGSAVFSGTGDIESDYSITDSDGSPTIDETEDIYGNLADIDGDVRFHHSDLDSENNILTISIKYPVTLTDLEEISPLGFFAGLFNTGTDLWSSLVGWMPEWLQWVVAVLGIIGVTLVLAVSFTETRIEKSAKKKWR